MYVTLRIHDRYNKHRRTYTHTDVFSMIFGCTEIIIGVSGAKLHEEADFDVQKWLAPQKPSQKCETQISEKKIRKKNRCQKMKCGESSETRFGKVSGRTEPCFRGKRPFKVCKQNRKLRNPSFVGRYWPLICRK